MEVVYTCNEDSSSDAKDWISEEKSCSSLSSQNVLAISRQKTGSHKRKRLVWWFLKYIYICKRCDRLAKRGFLFKQRQYKFYWFCVKERNKFHLKRTQSDHRHLNCYQSVAYTYTKILPLLYENTPCLFLYTL